MPTYQSPGVYVEEVAAGARPLEGAGTAVAAFVGLAEDGPFNTPTLVSNWTQFTNTFGGFVGGSYLAQSVYGYFMNGGGNCYVVRIGQNGSRQRPRHRGAARAKEIAAAPTAQIGRLKVNVPSTRRLQPGEVTVQIARPGGDSPSRGHVQASWSSATARSSRSSTGRPSAKGKQNVVTMVNAASKLDQARGHRQRQPSSGCPPARPRSSAPPPPAAVPSTRLSADDYVGDVADRTGFGGLEAVEEITMLCVPDLMSAYQQGVDRPGHGAGGADRDDRPLRADG